MLRLKVIHAQCSEVKNVSEYIGENIEAIAFWLWKEGMKFEDGIKLINEINDDKLVSKIVIGNWVNRKAFELTFEI